MVSHAHFPVPDVVDGPTRGGRDLFCSDSAGSARRTRHAPARLGLRDCSPFERRRPHPRNNFWPNGFYCDFSPPRARLLFFAAPLYWIDLVDGAPAANSAKGGSAASAGVNKRDSFLPECKTAKGCYSSRSATIGSRLDARNAGSQDAVAARRKNNIAIVV